MYEVKLVYRNEPRTQTLKESVTYCATIDLYTQYGIDAFQTSASRIAFESDRDRMLGLIYLSESRDFTAVCVGD